MNADYRAPYSERGPIHVTNVTVTGVASGSTAVHIRGTLVNYSTFEHVCTGQTGVNQSGLLVNPANCSISDSKVNVTGKAWIEQNGGSICSSNITFDGSYTSSEQLIADVRSGRGNTLVNGLSLNRGHR